MYEYVGNLHVHSTYSDGMGSIPEIARAAAQAGLDFVGVTDHNTLKGWYAGEEKWYGSVLVLIGVEINEEKNHYLAFNIQKEIEPDSDNPQRVIEAVKDQGGIGFLAHPYEEPSPRLLNGQSFPWQDWQVKGFDGIEIWNYCSQWREQVTSLLKALYWYVCNRTAPISGPSARCLEKWDKLNCERKVVGIGGTDAHAISLRIGFFRLVFFTYYELFRTINTHVLLREELSSRIEKAKEQIFQAMKDGNCFIGFDRLHDSKGFRFSAFNESEEVQMGQTLTFRRGNTSLKIISPSPRGLIRIIKNGRLVHQSHEQTLIFKVLKPGIFRVEVHWCPRWGKPRPWIFSNPVYIFSSNPEQNFKERKHNCGKN